MPFSDPSPPLPPHGPLRRVHSSTRWIDVLKTRPIWAQAWGGPLWVTPNFINAVFAVSDRLDPEGSVPYCVQAYFERIASNAKALPTGRSAEEGQIEMVLFEIGAGENTEDILLGIRHTPRGELYLAVAEDWDEKGAQS